MERHQQYLDGLVTSLKSQVQDNELFLAEIWESLSSYMLTDCTPVVLNRMFSDYGNYHFTGTVTLPGKNVRGEQYYEFYVDSDALDELILKMFYKPKHF
jgi:hypothetical protein